MRRLLLVGHKSGEQNGTCFLLDVYIYIKRENCTIKPHFPFLLHEEGSPTAVKQPTVRPAAAQPDGGVHGYARDPLHSQCAYRAGMILRNSEQAPFPKSISYQDNQVQETAGLGAASLG